MALILKGDFSVGKWGDAIITAQMKKLGIFEIYSNDADFDHIPNIKRIF